MVQERLRVTGATLKDVKAVKMTGLTGVVSEAIQRLRIREVQASAAYRKLLTVTVFLCVSSIKLPWINCRSTHANAATQLLRRSILHLSLPSPCTQL